MTVSQQLSRTAAIAAGFLLVVSACGSPESTRLPADLTTTTTTTTSSAVTTTTPPPVTVESIVDGRTAMLSNGTTVVLSGLAQPGECWAASAVEFATKTLVGKPVQVVASRLLLADGTDYAVLAVGQGAARAIAGADTAIQVAETAAKRATMGFWGPSCGGLDVKPAPVVAPPVAPQPQPKPQPAPPAPAPVSYANCTAVKAAGAAPLYRGQPGYSSSLDRDGDGVACEK
ncbi:excalibur calcium-binding domain-containing protein [Lentzea sp. BCCO 10_0061]|uniref:Excalibur calcium-binding domain-containing protein n=1 Tax=Lentzea sokolovensis TaxID=3095429 RepID=A0ABU4V288_9PSEU|nr:excalibur calcium-binding domain-containing protein [Lentzea sp. BCCO 10_0061]MDX8145799.1 excalibur calcium-binding domain-containing protein [Lentzea sp. BCCO 10_0061]